MAFDPNSTRLNRELLTLIMTGNRDGQNPNANGGKSGRDYAHILYPNEIEFYSCAIELVNGDDSTEEFFVLPIMPESYNHTEISEANIQKTMAGVVVSNNPTFVPFDIQIQGNFGRRFKRISNDYTSSKPVTMTGRVSTNINNEFDSDYKTGYGCYKILESIFRKAQKSDNFYNPRKLFFYNLSLNHQYLVEPISLNPSQNYNNSNMIWNYNLQMKTICPADAVNKDFKGSLKLITDYSKLTRVAIFQSDEIKSYRNRTGGTTRDKSKVEKIIERQTRGRVMGSFDTKTQNAIQSVLTLAEKPSGFDEFLINVGEGILNKF